MGHPMTKAILFLIMLSAFWGLVMSAQPASHADPWAEVTFYVS